ncbi:SMP-30/gluconolactonase/LRE family protein [Psychroflexus salinarum]|uniref:SMP-30/gluconolactonase/LRE family protein n=1 Tax=Psychroflexus salinarum TaxID=546024 RepID=A0ABW3GRK9_9FLAO
MKIIYYFSILALLVSCKNTSEEKTEKVSNETESVQKSKSKVDFKEVEKLAGDFVFTEGPSADAEGNVYFTDIPENKIYIWTTDDQLKTFKENTGGANGLYFDKDKNLLICEGQKGVIASINQEGEYKSIATEYNGKRFNQPNDIWADGKGGAYFTDPKYSNDLELPQESMQVYYINSDHTEVTRVTEDLVKPNGLIGTPDSKTLYITDPGANKTYKYSIQEDGLLSNKTLFTDLSGDGMTIDNEGNIYLTTDGKKAIDVFAPSGELISSVKIPEQPSNVSFGGEDLNELYITARTSIYRVKVNKTGAN